MVVIRAQTAISNRQTAVTVYFRSTQLLPFAFAKQTKTYTCITFIQRRPNVFDAGPTLYKCYTDGLCLLGK